MPTVEDLLAADPRLSGLGPDTMPGMYARDHLRVLARQAWSVPDLTLCLAAWPTVQDPFLVAALVAGFANLAREGLAADEAAAWMAAIVVPATQRPTALVDTVFTVSLGKGDAIYPPIRIYVKATGGDGHLALAAALAGLTPDEVRDGIAAGSLDLAGLEALAALRAPDLLRPVG